jgi:ribosomal protein S21
MFLNKITKNTLFDTALKNVKKKKKKKFTFSNLRQCDAYLTMHDVKVKL